MTSHQLINSTSGAVEYYTPQPIIEAARATMGSIDLDPASSAAANERVKARHWLGAGGLEADWYGNVWLNHPFSREGNKYWILKIIEQICRFDVKQICCITFAATSERWFQPLLRRPQCFLSPRTNYHLPDGTLKRGVTKGSVVTYFGPHGERFRHSFDHLGVCK